MPKLNWQPTKAEYWKNLPAPARPWPSEVAWFEKYALAKKAQGKKDILILGSTVELRSMLHQYKLNVHVVDFSKKFYQILSKQPMEFKGKEIFYEKNWLDMDLGKKFDLIFGDIVPGVLHSGDYGTFFKNVIKHLKDDGLFIGREWIRPNRKPVDIEKVAREYNKKYAGRYSFYESSMQYVYVYRPDPKTSMWNIKKAKQAMELIYSKGLIDQKNYDFMMQALSIEKEASASIMVKADFEKILKKYFIIANTHYGKEPTAAHFPIYILKK